MNVQITCNGDQSKIIELALDVLMRAQLDQFSIIKELVPPLNKLDYDTHNILSAIRHFNYVAAGHTCGGVGATHINLSRKNEVKVEKVDDL